MLGKVRGSADCLQQDFGVLCMGRFMVSCARSGKGGQLYRMSRQFRMKEGKKEGWLARKFCPCRPPHV